MVKACSRAYDGGFGGGSCTAELSSDNSPPDVSVVGKPPPIFSDAGKPSGVLPLFVLWHVVFRGSLVQCHLRGSLVLLMISHAPCRYFNVYLLIVGIPGRNSQGQKIIKQ